MDKATFSENIALLQSVFGSIAEEKTKALWIVLSGLKDFSMETATKRLILNFKPSASVPFPVPSDFVEAAGIGTHSKAQELLGLLQPAIFSVGPYRSIDFGSKAMHSVLLRFGGWVTVCGWNQEQWSINEGRLLKALEHALEYGEEGPDYMAGISEANNGSDKFSGLCHIKRNDKGKIYIGNGLNPNTLLSDNRSVPLENKIVLQLVDKFKMEN